MPDDALTESLKALVAAKGFRGRGPLCVALITTQHARSGLPLDPERLVTDGGGQMLGLGKGAVQAVLSKHGISRVLAQEGGRTSRGSLGKMRDYVAFLNERQREGGVDLDAVEGFWIERVHEFFAAKPFKLRMDTSKSLRVVVRDVLAQAEERQKTTPGMYYVGAVLQHLVGAKLDCALGKGLLSHNSFSTADAPTGRAGDFLIGDVAIHVTTSPSEAVVAKCADNLNNGLKAVLVTLQSKLPVAEGLADNAGIADRIDSFEVEQFIALNLYELGRFAAAGRQTAVRDVIQRYNEIVDEFETDPSLKIEVT